MGRKVMLVAIAFDDDDTAPVKGLHDAARCLSETLEQRGWSGVQLSVFRSTSDLSHAVFKESGAFKGRPAVVGEEHVGKLSRFRVKFEGCGVAPSSSMEAPLGVWDEAGGRLVEDSVPAGASDPLRYFADLTFHLNQSLNFSQPALDAVISYRESIMKKHSLPKDSENKTEVKLLPFVRLNSADDEDARLGVSPRMLVSVQVGGSVFSAKVFADVEGAVRFDPWTCEEEEASACSDVVQDAVLTCLSENRELIENSARNGWIDLRIVVVDETPIWSSDVVDRAGKVYCTYAYDAQRVTHACEITPSFEMTPLYSTPLRYLEDEAKREALEEDLRDGQARAGDDVQYMHSRRAEAMPSTHVMAWGCEAIDPEEWLRSATAGPEDSYRMQFDALVEQLRCNPVLQVPTNSADILAQLDAEQPVAPVEVSLAP